VAGQPADGPRPEVLGPYAPGGPLGAAARAWIAALPKAELHLHLDGSLRPETALELAASRRVEAPRTLAGMRRALVAPMPCADQAELLRAFDLPIRLMQDAEALERIAFELVEAKAAEGVRYVEIRWGPRLHTKRGLRLDHGIRAVAEGARRGAAATGTVVRLICTALRSDEPAENVRLAETAARFRADGLTGWDLAGPEAAFPDPLTHARAFEAALAGGLRVTIHAGEWGGAAQVRRALAVEPERIAHGAGTIDDPTLVRELADREIALDLCPTSNVQAGIVPTVAAHPLARLHRAGVPVTLSTDDTTVSDLTLTEESVRAIERIGLSLEELVAVNRRALDVAFAEEASLGPVRAALDDWIVANPIPDRVQSAPMRDPSR